MTAHIIDGNAIAAEVRREVATGVTSLLAAGGEQPGLAVVLVGNDPASHLAAPPAEPAEDAVPISECIGQIAPGRASANDPKHRFHEHPVVAARRTSRPLVANDVRRHALPLVVTKNQTVENTHSCLQKTALNLICSAVGIPRVHTT